MCVGTERWRNGENNNIYNNKRHACGVCEWVDGMYIFIYILQ